MQPYSSTIILRIMVNYPLHIETFNDIMYNYKRVFFLYICYQLCDLDFKTIKYTCHNFIN